jgi:hypothetical protein
MNATITTKLNLNIKGLNLHVHLLFFIIYGPICKKRPIRIISSFFVCQTSEKYLKKLKFMFEQYKNQSACKFFRNSSEQNKFR